MRPLCSVTEWIERYHLPYTPEQLFDLVADVARYPEFVPFILAAHIYRRTDRKVWTDMVAGTRFFRKRFSTVATLDRPQRISVSSYDPVFKRFEQTWTFVPASNGGTNIEYRVELRFRSPLLRIMLGPSFASRQGAMVSAFIRRAHALYGRMQR